MTCTLPCRRGAKPWPIGTRPTGPAPARRAPDASARVAATPAAPKPGRRMAREAQPSFLEDGQYSLPALTLLAEPKRPSTPTVSAEALEQNATLLEGTLEDFGVKG